MQERKRNLLRIGVHVENFVFEQAAQRARGDIADRVVAGLARSEPDIGQAMQYVWNVAQRNEMILDVLARGEVAFAPAKLVGNAGQLIHLPRGQDASGHLGADHVNAGLSLRVNAAAKALRAEFVVGDCARHPFVGVGPESSTSARTVAS